MADIYRPLQFPDGSGGWNTVGDPRLGDEIDGTLTAAKGYTDQEVGTRAPTVHDHPATDINDSTALGRTLMAVADADDGRDALGITVDTSVGTRVFVGGIMVHGDTGLRDVSDDLQSGFEAFGRLFLNRTGNRVSLEGNIVGEGATGDLLYTLPTGFRIIGGSYVTRVAAGSQERVTLRVNSGEIELESRTTRDAFLFSWTTRNPWPSTLPGTPV